jgi:RNA 3'-terminal phosphate cyclase
MSKQVSETLEEMLGILKQGQMTEGQKIYFADSVVTQEGNQPPVVGKQAAIERLDKFRETIGVDAFISYTIGAVAVTGNTSFYDSVLTVKLKNGQTISIEQVVKTDWKDGLIVKERYYHS